MIFFLLLGCLGPECNDAPTYNDWMEGFLRSKCQSCHSSEALYRYNAPENIHFDSYREAVDQLEIIRSSVLERESMPPGGGLSEEDKSLLAQWLDCPQ